MFSSHTYLVPENDGTTVEVPASFVRGLPRSNDTSNFVPVKSYPDHSRVWELADETWVAFFPSRLRIKITRPEVLDTAEAAAEALDMKMKSPFFASPYDTEVQDICDPGKKHPYLKGVRRSTQERGRWEAGIRGPDGKSTLSLQNTFDTPQAAARAHDEVTIKLWGTRDDLNAPTLYAPGLPLLANDIHGASSSSSTLKICGGYITTQIQHREEQEGMHKINQDRDQQIRHLKEQEATPKINRLEQADVPEMSEDGVNISIHHLEKQVTMHMTKADYVFHEMGMPGIKGYYVTTSTQHLEGHEEATPRNSEDCFAIQIQQSQEREATPDAAQVIQGPAQVIEGIQEPHMQLSTILRKRAKVIRKIIKHLPKELLAGFTLLPCYFIYQSMTTPMPDKVTRYMLITANMLSFLFLLIGIVLQSRRSRYAHLLIFFGILLSAAGVFFSMSEYIPGALGWVLSATCLLLIIVAMVK